MDLLGCVGDPVGEGGDELGKSGWVVHFDGVVRWCGYEEQRGNSCSVECSLWGGGVVGWGLMERGQGWVCAEKCGEGFFWEGRSLTIRQGILLLARPAKDRIWELKMPKCA